MSTAKASPEPEERRRILDEMTREAEAMGEYDNEGHWCHICETWGNDADHFRQAHPEEFAEEEARPLKSRSGRVLTDEVIKEIGGRMEEGYEPDRLKIREAGRRVIAEDAEALRLLKEHDQD